MFKFVVCICFCVAGWLLLLLGCFVLMLLLVSLILGFNSVVYSLFLLFVVDELFKCCSLCLVAVCFLMFCGIVDG